MQLEFCAFFFRNRHPRIAMTYTKLTQATPVMATLCFKYLKEYLDGNGEDGFNSTSKPEEEQFVEGLFITWETLTGDLRGCIGSLREMPLSNMQEYAITSSQHDTRFSPIRISEMRRLQCKVSILHTMERCCHSKDWTIGVHGIIVEFSFNGSNYKATFLPSVMVEQNWSKSDALKHACMKSGYRGPYEQVSEIICVTRYQASVASCTYSDYTSKYS